MRIRGLLPPEAWYILILVGVSRAALTVVGFMSRLFLWDYYPYNKDTFFARLPLDVWGQWDTEWYMKIATDWYPRLTDLSVFQSEFTEYPFFPLFPLLMKLVGYLVGTEYRAGLLIANLSLVAACYLLFKLVELDRDRDAAYNSVNFLILFPTAFILSGVLTESLYLALALGCFLAARHGKWWMVGVLGALLALTRNLGVLIILPMFWIYMEQRSFRLRDIRPDVLYLLLVPAALGLHSLHVYLLTGDPLAYIHAQLAWRQELFAPNPFRVIGQVNFGNWDKRFNLIFLGLFTGVLCGGIKRIGFPAWMFGIYTILVPLASSMMSIKRFFCVVFPLAMIFGGIKNERARFLLTIFFAFLQAFMMVFWANGHWFVI
jgi:hypothetical protein